MKFHFESGEIHCSKETYEFAIENQLATNRYFEIRDTKGNDLLMPWSVSCHLEALSNQLIHFGSLVRNIEENDPDRLSEIKDQTLFIDAMQYGLHTYFYIEIKIVDKTPVCKLFYKSKQNGKTNGLTFPLQKFVSFLKDNFPCATMYIGYSKGLYIEHQFPSFPREKNYSLLRPKHVHQTSHILFECTCPPSDYEKFAKNNKLVRCRDV